MINEINTRVQSHYTSKIVVKNCESSFDECLVKATTNYNDEKLAKAPDKWVTEDGIIYKAEEAVLDFLKNQLEINGDKSEPTHEITEEQREWLNLRHDFSTMQKSIRYSWTEENGSVYTMGKITAEYSNFIADLLYLNVYSQEELRNIYMQPVAFDKTAQLQCVDPSVFNEFEISGGNILETVQEGIVNYQKLYDYFNKALENSLTNTSETQKAAQMISEYLSLYEEFFALLTDLVGNTNEEFQYQNSVPPVINVSETIAEEAVLLRDKLQYD